MAVHKSKKTKEKLNETKTAKNQEINDAPIKKNEQLDPVTFVKFSIFFFFIDSLAFQKPLSNFLSWVLLIIPLLLLSTSFFLWAKRKQFPFLSFPFNPLMTAYIFEGEEGEKNNMWHAVMGLIACIFLIVSITYVFIFK